MTSTFKTLETEGVAMTLYPEVLRRQVDEAAQSWRAFLALPDDDKDRFMAYNNSTGIGYERKDGVGKNADRKENFDITPEYSQTTVGGGVAESFIGRAVSLSETMSSYALQMARGIGAEYHIETLERLQPDGLTTFVRFLHYPGGRQIGDLIGEPHTDQSGFTFHLYETAAGCERLDPVTREWLSMPVSKDSAAVFGAMQLQLLSEGRLPALAHRIRATEQTHKSGRQAIVCFVRFTGGVLVYDKETHGRLQEFEPGFNYDMEPAEFAKLFTKGK